MNWQERGRLDETRRRPDPDRVEAVPRDWLSLFFVFALPLGLLTIFSLTSSGVAGVVDSRCRMPFFSRHRAGAFSTAADGEGGRCRGQHHLLPVDVFAGVWTPGELMPESIRFLWDITPMGAGTSAMQYAWAGSWPAAVHVISLLVFSALCLVVAARFFRWD